MFIYYYYYPFNKHYTITISIITIQFSHILLIDEHNTPVLHASKTQLVCTTMVSHGHGAFVLHSCLVGQDRSVRFKGSIVPSQSCTSRHETSL